MSKENAVYRSGVLLSHKDEIMSFAAKWMKLEATMLSEISQIQTDK
jgi:hypothetical protein